MIHCRPLVLLVIALLSGSAIDPARAAEQPGAGFFRPGPLAPATLPERGIYPAGRTMHLGGYSAASEPVRQLGGIVPLELARQSGFTVAGPYYGPFKGWQATAERAAALGMHVAAQLEVPPALRFTRDEAKDALKLRGPRMAALPEADLRAWVRTDMEQVLSNPALNRAVSCWAIAPEELRCWIKPELAYEHAFLKAVNDFDPEHRPAFMYEPNNRTTESLLKTGPGQGYVLEGSYVHRYGWDVRRALRINWAMDQMTGAAARDRRPVVPGLELSQDMPGFTARELQADPGARARLRRLLRHDVYLALARGAQGFQVWSLFHSRPGMTTYLELMNGYGEAFRELTAPPLNLQEAILFGEHRQDVTLEVVSGPAVISQGGQGGELDAVEGKINVQKQSWPSVRMANLAYGNRRVLILVNSAAEPVRVRLGGIPATARLAVLSGGDAAKVETAVTGTAVALAPFAALVLQATPAPGS